MRSTTVSRGFLFVATLLVAAACGGDDTAASSTSVTTTSVVAETTTSTSAADTTTTQPGATTSSLPGGVDAVVTVANADGALLVENDFTFLLVEGPVELAIADGSGGLVFQRTSEGSGDPAATVISFLPADSFEPQDLLVPTGDQYLQLRDVKDGVVWYTRRVGDNPDNATETLRRYDLASKTVDEFAVTGGWESGSIEVSVGGPHVAAFWSAEAATGFTFYAESGDRIGLERDPYGPDRFCGDGQLYDFTDGDFVGGACFEYAELSDDGRLAYYERDFDGADLRYILVVVDLDTGQELFRQDLKWPDQGWVPKTMDLQGDQIIVNRSVSGAYGASYIDAFLVDLATGGVTEIGVDGQARFLVGPMGID